VSSTTSHTADIIAPAPHGAWFLWRCNTAPCCLSLALRSRNPTTSCVHAYRRRAWLNTFPGSSTRGHCSHLKKNKKNMARGNLSSHSSFLLFSHPPPTPPSPSLLPPLPPLPSCVPDVNRSVLGLLRAARLSARLSPAGGIVRQVPPTRCPAASANGCLMWLRDVAMKTRL